MKTIRKVLRVITNVWHIILLSVICISAWYCWRYMYYINNNVIELPTEWVSFIEKCTIIGVLSVCLLGLFLTFLENLKFAHRKFECKMDDKKVKIRMYDDGFKINHTFIKTKTITGMTKGANNKVVINTTKYQPILLTDVPKSESTILRTAYQ